MTLVLAPQGRDRSAGSHAAVQGVSPIVRLVGFLVRRLPREVSAVPFDRVSHD